MKGKIIFFNEEQGWGFIRGEDAEKYYFRIKSAKDVLEIRKNIFVQFEPIKNERDKLEAINISINNTQKSKNQRKSNKTITINNETILVSSIQSYELETRRPHYSSIGVFDESGNWGSSDYCYNKYSDGFDTYGEDYWYISDYIDCMDTYIENNFDYWYSGTYFDEDKYLRDLEDLHYEQAKYFIKIKFKNGKKKNFFIGRYEVPYEIKWIEKCVIYSSDDEFENQVAQDQVSLVKYDGVVPYEFDRYYEVYDSYDEDKEYTIRLPKLKYTEEFDSENDIYKEGMQIINDIGQLINNM